MRYRPLAVPQTPEQLLAGVNTTPLIDVMLVLLIMFIMIIPTTTHKIQLDLPHGEGAFDPVVHRIALGAGGALTWNGAPVAEAALPARLIALSADKSAVLHFRVEGDARYEDFDRVLAIIKHAGIERLGLVDNGRFVEQ